MNYEETFRNIIAEKVSRAGVEELLDHLANETDFFTSPASTKYHGSYHGGLAEHSLNVYYCLIDELRFIYGNGWQDAWSEESVVLVSLFHDLCKIGRYKSEIRNVKNPETGTWDTAEVFVYDNNYFRMGHAARSVHELEKYVKLTDEEAQAIYWHMGAFDTSPYNTVGDLSEAYSSNTLAFALHRADMMATHVVENKKFVPLE